MTALVNDFTYTYTAPAEAFWDETHPVVVVGGGPVGLAAALGLAKRGIKVVLLEATDSVSVGSRAICTSRHSLEILDHLGVGDRVQDRSIIWDSGRSYFRDEQILQFTMPNDPKFVRPPMVNLSQADIEQYTYEELVKQENAVVLPLCPLTGISFEDGGAHGSSRTAVLSVSTPDGDRTLRANWVLACDGARSPIREAMGLQLAGTAYEGRYVIADIVWKTDWSAERKVWFDAESNPGQTIIMHCQPDDIWRIDYQLGDDEDAEEQQKPDVIRARINKHLTWLGYPADDWEMIWSSLYSARALALDDFRHDNVLFVGDAAHLVPIFGVRGMNSGLEDASTAVWQLAAVINGNAEPALLDTYASERRFAWEQNIANATLSTLFMTPGTFGYRASRQAVLPLISRRPELSHLVNPRQSSATHSRGSLATWGGEGIDAGVHPGDPVSDTTFGDGSTLFERGGAGFMALAPTGHDDVAQSWADAFGSAFPLEGAKALTLSAADLELLGITGEHVVVLRPEGVVVAVAKVDDETDPSSVVAGLVKGNMASPHTTERVHRTPGKQVEAVEAVWKGISDGLDSTATDEERIQFLSRAVLLLAMAHEDPSAIKEAFDTAAATA